MLAADHNADFISQRTQFFGNGACIFFRTTGICNHHHIKITLYTCLGNIPNVYIVFCKICTYLCNNSYGVVSYYSDNCFLNGCFLSVWYDLFEMYEISFCISYTVMSSEIQSRLATWILKSLDL